MDIHYPWNDMDFLIDIHEYDLQEGNESIYDILLGYTNKISLSQNILRTFDKTVERHI